MNTINSVAKGAFFFKNGKSLKELKKKRNSIEPVNKQNKNQHWYKAYNDERRIIEEKLDKIQSESYAKTLNDLLTYIQEANTNDPNLQTAVLLTGVNQTDHFKQFGSLSQTIVNNCYSIATILESRNCPNIKSAIETLVYRIIYNSGKYETSNETLSSEDDDEDEDERKITIDKMKLKKKQLTLSVLEAWFSDNYKKMKPKIVILLTDFEKFNPVVIQDMIGILCAYTSKLPLVLIMGIATTLKTLHNVLPFHITCKISANVFQAQSATSMLNKILDEIILTHQCPFFLSAKSFNVLVDIFLFYDYSIHNFIHGFKIFMREQFSRNTFSQIYSPEGKMFDGLINQLTQDECDSIRRSCMSFRRHVEQEDPQTRIELIKNDLVLKDLLIKQKKIIYRFFFKFFTCLKMLAALIEDLPRNNLGTLPRELYPICASEEIIKNEKFQECFKYIRFTAKDQFLVKLNKIIKILEASLKDNTVSEPAKAKFNKYLIKLREYFDNISKAGMSPIKLDQKNSKQQVKSTLTDSNEKVVMSRQQMMEKLKESALNQSQRVVIEYEKILVDCLNYLHNIFESNLIPFSKGPTFIELFVFSDYLAVRRQIVGSPRGAIHNALSNPHHYLQCNSCELKDNEQILPTMPDICIAYKLHLECNKFINLYDWLQAFSIVISNQDDDEENSITPEIHARFVRATSELQFLGLIKQAKQKTDHVMRLTW